MGNTSAYSTAPLAILSGGFRGSTRIQKSLIHRHHLIRVGAHEHLAAVTPWRVVVIVAAGRTYRSVP